MQGRPRDVQTAGSATSTTSAGSFTASTTTPTSATDEMSSTAGMPMPAAPAGPYKQADITFAQQMTIHHQGAIAMADPAPPAPPAPR